jgi:hypothetical protein
MRDPEMLIGPLAVWTTTLAKRSPAVKLRPPMPSMSPHPRALATSFRSRLAVHS